MSPDISQLNSVVPSPVTFGAIGDAYGFCFEFAPDDFVERNNDLRYHQHPEFDVTPGVYSDDTQMQLALAELLISGEAWTQASVADAFVRTFKRDPRHGYAMRFLALLDEIESGDELLERINPESERNGAAMRAPVIGIIRDTERVIEYATLQATVTHNTTGGIDSAVAAALMSHYFIYDLGPKDQLTSFLAKHVPNQDWSADWQGSVPVHGISTAQAALTVIRSSASLSEILTRSVQFTGDVDSVGAIACACASSSSEITRDVPNELWEGLEDSEFGLVYLQETDCKLRARYFD